MPSQALIVIDVQNGFCDGAGSMVRAAGPLACLDQAIAGISRAVTAAREAGTSVVFTRHVFRAGGVDMGRNFRRRLAGVDPTALIEGSWDAELLSGLMIDGDVVVNKCRYDAFLWTPLQPLLEGMGITEVVLCGVATNVCVESTARSAFMRDFDVTILADCCAGRSQRLHDLSLEMLAEHRLARVASMSHGFRFSPGGTATEERVSA